MRTPQWLHAHGFCRTRPACMGTPAGHPAIRPLRCCSTAMPPHGPHLTCSADTTSQHILLVCSCCWGLLSKCLRVYVVMPFCHAAQGVCPAHLHMPYSPCRCCCCCGCGSVRVCHKKLTSFCCLPIGPAVALTAIAREADAVWVFITCGPSQKDEAKQCYSIRHMRQTTIKRQNQSASRA